jgi:hypothetical protein
MESERPTIDATYTDIAAYVSILSLGSLDLIKHEASGAQIMYSTSGHNSKCQPVVNFGFPVIPLGVLRGKSKKRNPKRKGREKPQEHEQRRQVCDRFGISVREVAHRVQLRSLSCLGPARGQG